MACNYWLATAGLQLLDSIDSGNLPPPRLVHRHVMDRVVSFLTVPQRACARRVSHALCEAVIADSMEDLLSATVLVQQEMCSGGTQLVVLALGRSVGPFRSNDAAIAWCGGLALLYEELQLHFPHAAAIGISTRLAATRPFPFASGSATTTMCIVTDRPAQALESIVLGVRSATSVRALFHDGTACPILCFKEAMPDVSLHLLQSVPLSSLAPIDCIPSSKFFQQLCLSRVVLSGLPSLRFINGSAFEKCESLRFASLENLPLLERIGRSAFANCSRLSTVHLSGLPSLRRIGEGAFAESGLEFICLVDLPALESVGVQAFFGCRSLCKVKLSGLPALRSIRKSAFEGCGSLNSICLEKLPRLRRLEEDAFSSCGLRLVKLCELPSLQGIGETVFMGCSGMQSVCLENLPRLESIGTNAFLGCSGSYSIQLTGVPNLYAAPYDFMLFVPRRQVRHAFSRHMDKWAKRRDRKQDEDRATSEVERTESESTYSSSEESTDSDSEESSQLGENTESDSEIPLIGIARQLIADIRALTPEPSSQSQSSTSTRGSEGRKRKRATENSPKPQPKKTNKRATKK